MVLSPFSTPGLFSGNSGSLVSDGSVGLQSDNSGLSCGTTGLQLGSSGSPSGISGLCLRDGKMVDVTHNLAVLLKWMQWMGLLVPSLA